MVKSLDSQQGDCKSEECGSYAFELTTSWIKNTKDESSERVKAIADILRERFDDGLFQTLMRRNIYRKDFTFADFCYMSGNICCVEELEDGRYKVFLPGCLFDAVYNAYAEQMSVFRGYNNITQNIKTALRAGTLFGLYVNYKTVKCPFKETSVINIEGKELPEQTTFSEGYEELYLKEIENHGKRSKIS